MDFDKLKPSLGETRQDKVLYSRIKKKDREAFIQAYDFYADHIYRFIFFKINDKAEAQDLTSVVFLKTWNYVLGGNLKDYKTLKSLIYKIARNTIIDHYRTLASKTADQVSLEASEIDLPDEKQNIAGRAEINSDMELIQTKLSQLKDEYREIIILRFIEGLSIGEVAEIVDKPKGNVRVISYRALKALRDLMDQNNS